MTGKCDRCYENTARTMMSLFNMDMCCDLCIENEQAHPSYVEARDRELDELSKGNYNFPGIGLPEDLKIRKEKS
jgi:hypothetical protein